MGSERHSDDLRIAASVSTHGDQFVYVSRSVGPNGQYVSTT